jgi:outer membrane protein assembly factor BamB
MKRAILAVALASLALGGCNWFRGMGKKDNVEPPTALTELSPSANIQRLWTAKVGDGAGTTGAAMHPAVSGDRVYVASIDGTLQALDASSGRSVWTNRDKKLKWTGSPAVYGDLLVVGAMNGEVHGFSAADGSPRWQVKVSSEVIAAPAISDAIVALRAQNGRIYGLDPNDGTRKWVYEQTVPLLSLRGNASPVIGKGLVFGAFDSGRLVALRESDGGQAWVQTLSAGEGRTEVERLADADGQIVIDGDELFAVGYRGQLGAFYAESGRPAWGRELSSYAGLAVNATAVVISDAEGNVWAFDRQNGANLWKQDGLKYRWLSAPAIAGGYAVVGDLEGFVHWMSLDDGRFVARERLGKKPIEGAPVVSGDVVYVEDVEGRVAAYRAQ